MIEVHDDLSIDVSRGDSAALTFVLEGELPEQTQALFTVRGYGKTVIERVVEIADGTVEIVLSPDETNLQTGEYRWDLRLRMGDDIHTPQLPATFRVLEVVGDGKRLFEAGE